MYVVWIFYNNKFILDVIYPQSEASDHSIQATTTPLKANGLDTGLGWRCSHFIEMG